VLNCNDVIEVDTLIFLINELGPICRQKNRILGGYSVNRFNIVPIGFVSSPISEPVDKNWGQVVSRIALKPEFKGGLSGLESFSHAIVVTYLDRARFDPSKHLCRRPRGLESMPEVGTFSQRSKDRPNPIGITTVCILAVGTDSLDVKGLDAIDGTPVIDIKPYYPHYDQILSPRIPDWVNELMKDYF
jgi:tRNA-Thr(GGU) m(6)t(6)A37 methyltransferase TsaA